MHPIVQSSPNRMHFTRIIQVPHLTLADYCDSIEYRSIQSLRCRLWLDERRGETIMKKTMCKRLSSLSAAIGLAFALGACKSEVPVESTSTEVEAKVSTEIEATSPTEVETTVSAEAEITSPTETETTTPKEIKAPWIVEIDEYSGTLPIELPEGCESLGDETYLVKQDQYAEWLSQLISQGYKLDKGQCSDYLFSDDRMISLDFSQERSKRFEDGEDKFVIRVIQRTSFVCPDGISSEEAASRLPNGRGLLARPIDITTEEIYEMTGGQVFAVPAFFYGIYTVEVYFVKGEDQVRLSMRTFAIADIDEDGSDDLLTINYGPTSGFFTFTLECITNHGFYSSGLFYSNMLIENHGYSGPELTLNNGKVRIGDCWDVILKDTPDGKYVILDCDGQEYSGGLGWIDEPSENDVPDRE